MLANKHNGESNLLRSLKDESTLRRWFKPDGSLMPKRTATKSFQALPGYRNHAADIGDLLRQLGNHQLADALLPPVSAEMVAAVLKERVKSPAASSDELLETLGLKGHYDIHYYVHPGTGRLATGRLAKSSRIDRLPGYHRHWKEIRKALEQLGHDGQAARLPKPVSKASVDFVDRVEKDIDALQAALQAVRQGQLSRGEAAELANLTDPGLLRALSDKYGNLRHLLSIVSRTEQNQIPLHVRRLRKALVNLQPRTLETARDLKLALQGMLANKAGGKKDVRRGLPNEDDLKTWFNADGSLLPTRSAIDIGNLGGYPIMADEIRDALLWLGRHDVVRELPTPMSAKAIANALQEKVKNPQADILTIAEKAELPMQMFNGYLDLSRNALRRDRVARLPDYPEYWQQIRDWLLAS
jgi:hypothetical protein